MLSGNELSGNGVGARIGADQYAADVISLHSIVNDNYRAVEVKPLILAPGGFFDANWFKELIDKTSPNSMDVITHHIYNLGPGIVGCLLVSCLLTCSFHADFSCPKKWIHRGTTPAGLSPGRPHMYKKFSLSGKHL